MFGSKPKRTGTKKTVDENEKRKKEIEKITSADLSKLAKQIIKNKKLNLAIVGKYKDESRFKKILKV